MSLSMPHLIHQMYIQSSRQATKYSCGVFEPSAEKCNHMLMLYVSKIRKAKGLTQAQLAELVGVSQAHISRLENGDDSASLKLIYEIAHALNVLPSDLFEERSAKEALLLEVFRSSSPEAQKMVLGMMEAVRSPKMAM